MFTFLILVGGVVLGFLIAALSSSGIRYDLETALMLAKQENTELASANAFLLMEKHHCGLGNPEYRCNPLPSLRGWDTVQGADTDGDYDAIDRGEGASPRFVLNPNRG